MKLINNRYTGLWPLIIFLMLTAHAVADIPCEYDVTIIQAPVGCGGFGTVITVGLGINENGAVVGYYQCPLWEHSEAFVWTAEDGFITLDRPEGVYSAGAVDINDNGVICGTAWMFDLGKRGFVYEDGEWTILDPVIPDAGWSSAAAINNAGVVVGWRSITKDLSPRSAYMWSAKEGFTDLGVMEGPSSFASGISETGIIVGWTGNQTGSAANAFIWESGDLTLIGFIPEGFTSQALAVTNNSVVVGKGRIPLKGAPVGASRAFLWKQGKFTMLGTLPDHARSSASDGVQQVVGRSWNVDGVPTIAHAFIWQDGVMRNLNDFIPPEFPVLVKSAARITKSGQILANGDDEAGEIVAIVLTPIAALLGDLNDDCIVDLSDLSILLKNWGRCPDDGACDTDLDQNGITSTTDLLILLANWT